MAEIPIQRKPRRNVWPLLILLLLIVAVAWYLWSRNASATRTASADSTTVAASNGAVATAPAAAPVTPAASAASDAQIVAIIRAVNDGEVSAGRLAESNASSPDVKAFAREMVRDHQQMNDKLAAAARSAGADAGAANDSVRASSTALASTLQSAGRGPAFDKAYLNAQVEGHQRVLTFLQQAQARTQNAELRQLTTDAAPAVQAHLDRARALQSKVGP
jgi:putative membrane protein